MSSHSDLARAYSRKEGERFRQELHELIRISSLSGDPAHADDVRRASEWLVNHMSGLGLDNVAVMPTAGHPVAYGEYLGAGPDKPTVLVYGHYDAVPASKEEGWNTEPFEPVEKDGKIYARGATDDKGQLFLHLKAFESFNQTGDGLPVNIKFLLEGEEEVSSPNLRPFIDEHLDLLIADVCVISDSSMPAIDKPVITHSLRGMTYLEIRIEGPNDDLHSGFYGGAVHNPALAPVEFLSKLLNADHNVAVPGFYDDVVALTPIERAEVAKTGITEEQLKSATGTPAVWGEEANTIKERVSARPTLEINGMLSGWTGPKTIIPAMSMAKVSCRLVGIRDPHKIHEQIKAFNESITPPTVKVDVNLITTGEPALIAFTIPEMQAAARAFERGWGAVPAFTRGGGSIPIVADIVHLMKTPVVMMGYGLDTDGLHGTNEHFTIEMFHRGVETSTIYLDELAQLPR